MLTAVSFFSCWLFVVCVDGCVVHLLFVVFVAVVVACCLLLL